MNQYTGFIQSALMMTFTTTFVFKTQIRWKQISTKHFTFNIGTFSVSHPVIKFLDMDIGYLLSFTTIWFVAYQTVPYKQFTTVNIGQICEMLCMHLFVSFTQRGFTFVVISEGKWVANY